MRTRGLTAAIVDVVSVYQGWCPLSVDVLCRALIARQHPLSVVGVRHLADLMEEITPVQINAVRRAATKATAANIIPLNAVDLDAGAR